MNETGIRHIELQEFHRRRLRALQVRALGLVVTAFGIFLVTSHSLLSARYNVDAEKIQSIASGEVTNDDKAFSAVADIYRSLGMANHATVAGLSGYVLFVLVLWAVVGRRDLEQTDWLTIATLVASTLFAALYLGEYSKDVLVLAITLIAGRGPRKSLAREVVLLTAMAAMALYVRTYWELIAGVYLVTRWAVAKKHRPRRMVLEIALLYVFLAVLMWVVRHEPLDFGRTSVNDARVLNMVPVHTIVNEPTSLTGFTGGLVNSLVIFLFLIVPIPLISAGPFYAVAGLLIAGSWVATIRVLLRYQKEKNARDPILERSFALLFAMLIVQSLFEPDYGSYLRHLTPLLPLMVLTGARLRAVLAIPRASSPDIGLEVPVR